MVTEWDFVNVFEYYKTHRKTYEDLYDSEKYFLDQLNLDNYNILDIGCALGGFYEIFSSLGKNISYTGVDVSPKLIQFAKHLHPNVNFFLIDPSLNTQVFPENNFDLVFSSGVFHLNKEWQSLLLNAYRLTRNYLLIDFRILPDQSLVGKIRLNLGMNAENPPEIDYFILNINELLDIFLHLNPLPQSIRSYGYYRPVSEDAELEIQTVCMSFFLIEKPQKQEPKNIDFSFNLPDDFAGVIENL